MGRKFKTNLQSSTSHRTGLIPDDALSPILLTLLADASLTFVDAAALTCPTGFTSLRISKFRSIGQILGHAVSGSFSIESLSSLLFLSRPDRLKSAVRKDGVANADIKHNLLTPWVNPYIRSQSGL